MLFNLPGLLGLVKTEDEEYALKHSDVEKDLSRDPFSKYLMPVAYDPDKKIFYNQDETVGLIFECVPLLALNSSALKTLEGLFRVNYPEGTVLQFILYADPNIEDFLSYYRDAKKFAPDFVKKAYQSMTEYYARQEVGNPPIRNFRSFVCIKMPAKKIPNENFIDEVVTSVREILQSTMLAPLQCGAEEYLSLMRRLLNVRVPQNEGVWTEAAPLNRQVILADTEIEIDTKEGFVKIHGEVLNGSGSEKLTRYMRCITPKSLPPEIDWFWVNRITGSYDGVSGDVSQINTPFLYVLNVLVQDLKSKLYTKSNLILQQQAFGSWVVSLRRKQDEFLWAVGELDRGQKFFQIVPIMWVFSFDKEATRTAVYRAQKLWEATGAVMQEDKYLLGPLLAYSLPFGFYASSKNLDLLDRDFVVPLESLPPMIPVQADYSGAGAPVLMFIGRKGQLVGVDLFAKGTSNYNFYVAAPTGKGKSFTVNYLVTNYYGAGAKIRIVDIGGSYRKLTKIFNGKYLEFSPESNICINPFANVKDPEYDIPVIAQIVMQMVISSTGKLPEMSNQESIYNLIFYAVRWALNNFGSDASVDHVFQWLNEFPKHLEENDILCEGKETCLEDFKLLATHLAFNLNKFTSTGPYGRWFNGVSNVDISQDDFVVLELEHLKGQPDLFQVVVLQVLNAVTMDLYLSDRSRPRLIVVDEAWQFLQDTPQFQKVIEEGYRRARKYGGSFGIITQSITDLEQFGRVGRVINLNSAFKFFLESSDFRLAKEKKLIDYDEFVMRVLESLKYNAPKYSEVFIHSDAFGVGVGRLMVDPYSYYVYTSNPKEISEIESMVAQGLSYEEAIQEMIKKYRSER